MGKNTWIPVYTGMTKNQESAPRYLVIPAQAGIHEPAPHCLVIPAQSLPLRRQGRESMNLHQKHELLRQV